ncbi:hypothetical protein BSLG_010243 [Batrachochytrium salamandrivorans]|nr:hypothetical protein BSLG_010243 [Batrachochytrium salamandrivorans]
MYNGIGLSTARGSGTNGYVQRNMSALRPRSSDFKREGSRPGMSFNDSHSNKGQRKPNQDILEHERKRQIEIQCLQLQDTLEEESIAAGKDTPEEEMKIAEQVNALRSSLLANLTQVHLDATNIKSHEVHRIAEAKEHANRRFESAFGIDTTDFVEGGSFDQERLDRKREERAAERRRKDIEYRERRERQDKANQEARELKAKQEAAQSKERRQADLHRDSKRSNSGRNRSRDGEDHRDRRSGADSRPADRGRRSDEDRLEREGRRERDYRSQGRSEYRSNDRSHDRSHDRSNERRRPSRFSPSSSSDDDQEHRQKRSRRQSTSPSPVAIQDSRQYEAKSRSAQNTRHRGRVPLVMNLKRMLLKKRPHLALWMRSH